MLLVALIGACFSARLVALLVPPSVIALAVNVSITTFVVWLIKSCLRGNKVAKFDPFNVIRGVSIAFAAPNAQQSIKVPAVIVYCLVSVAVVTYVIVVSIWLKDWSTSSVESLISVSNTSLGFV
jgi:hypothetical protein